MTNYKAAIVEGSLLTVQGMLIVFLVLVILMLVLMAMRFISKKDKVKDVALPIEDKKEIIRKNDDGELIAILTAAIACSLNTSSYNLNIKSYRRIGSNSPKWNAISREENTKAGGII